MLRKLNPVYQEERRTKRRLLFEELKRREKKERSRFIRMKYKLAHPKRPFSRHRGEKK
jgi:hypothetical protein